MNRKLVRPADFVLIGLVLCAAAGFFWWSFAQPSQELTAVVRQDGEVVERIPLASITESRHEVLPDCEPAVCILVEPDGVCFETADCPDQLCVRTGKLTRAGQSAVCLPARVSVTLEGGGDAASPDAVTG
ncbi:MAG: NusG domain II-containing protein [Clostridiales bacterium]|nr:NusG domain II-containing protein [Clostridiales bacterium]